MIGIFSVNTSQNKRALRRACKISGKIVTTEQAALTAKHHGREIRGVLLFLIFFQFSMLSTIIVQKMHRCKQRRISKLNLSIFAVICNYILKNIEFYGIIIK